MKRLILILVVAGLLAMGGQAFAELCAIDAVPAATLLVPYFEVDLDDTTGVTTLFSINNASAAATIAHVIFWTDWSAPTIDFDIFLTGYDVVTVNVRDVFDGNIPITADDPNDADDAISPHGNNAVWDGDFSTGALSCEGIFPFFSNPVVTGPAFDRLVNGHTGAAVGAVGGDCLGADHGDNVARGYITIDNASDCSLILDPTDAAYFVNGGLGIANNINQLWGDWFLVDFGENFAQGDTLVHIEADDTFVGTADTGYTFYGRYSNLLPDGRDNREPLGTSWGSRYLNGGAFDQSELIVWRDSTFNGISPAGEECGSLADRLACGAAGCVGPEWFPLNETEVIAFNEIEDAVQICFFQGGVISPPQEDDPACFPYETGRYPIGSDPLSIPYNFGWLYMNLNIPNDAGTGDQDFPLGGNVSQSYVTTIHSALGAFSVGLSAVELWDACQPEDLTVLTDLYDISDF